MKKGNNSTDFNMSMVHPPIFMMPSINSLSSHEKHEYMSPFYTLVDNREDLSYLNALSIVRSFKKLLSKKVGT